jgi:hypothetical protein
VHQTRMAAPGLSPGLARSACSDCWQGSRSVRLSRICLSRTLDSVNAAFSVSFTLTLILNWLLNREFDITRDFNGATSVWRSISAFDLIIMTMVIALALFHYWRAEDSASTPIIA